MYNVKITDQSFAALESAAKMFKKMEFASYSIEWVAKYFLAHNALPPKEVAEMPSTQEIAQCDYASLPGMSLAVIQSHLIRFPKVDIETYKRILAHMNAQHAEGTLKNPEAAAYGMCKLAQNGKLPDFLKPAEPQAPATATPTEATSVPQAALMPFATK